MGVRVIGCPHGVEHSWNCARCLDRDFEPAPPKQAVPKPDTQTGLLKEILAELRRITAWIDRSETGTEKKG